MLGPLLDIKINNTLVTRAKSVGLAFLFYRHMQCMKPYCLPSPAKIVKPVLCNEITIFVAFAKTVRKIGPVITTTQRRARQQQRRH